MIFLATYLKICWKKYYTKWRAFKPIHIDGYFVSIYSFEEINLVCTNGANLPTRGIWCTVPKAAHISEKCLGVYMGASPLAGKFPKAV
jgi:hypothetical protein